MRITVKPHEIKIIKEEKVNENEYKVNKCYFEFSEDYTDDLVKVARFTTSAGTYKQYIIDNECDIPPEVLTEECTCILGVYSYLSENDELKLRFSPKPDRFYITEGSYVENAENSEPITPTDKEQIEQAIVNLDNDKQDKLISGENIKTINGASLLGEGDIEIDQDFVKDDNYVHTDNNYTTDEKDKLSELENYDDSEIREDISELENNKVDKIEGKGLSTNDYTTDEKNKLAGLSNYDDTEVKSSISNLQTNKADRTEIPDVSNFITRSVDNLLNYYLKSETYTKEQVNQLVSTITSVRFELVSELPSTGESNVIYLVPSSNPETQNVKDEYIWINNSWEQIGSTSIDLSDYVTVTQLNTALNNYTTTTDLTALLNTKQNTIDSLHKLSSDLVDDTNKTNKFVTSQEKTTWNGKYNKPSGGIPKTDLTSDVQSSLSKADVSVSTTTFENSQTVQDNAINNINNELDAFFKKTVSGTEIYSNRTLNWKLGLKINGNTGGVTGNNTVKILSKNVYDKNTPTEAIYYDETGNPQIATTGYFINQEIPIFDKFVISYSGKFGVASFIRVIQYDDNNNFIRRSLISANNQVITPESNTARILVSINAGPSDYFTDLQIERGEIPTEYSEYQSQSYPINLGNIILNENDYIYKDNGNWYTKISGTDTQITDNNLIEQLNTMNSNASSFEGVTYIYSEYASSPINFNADIYVSMAPDLTDYVKNTDFAQNNSVNGGVVRYANGVYGIKNIQNGYIGIIKPTDAEIEAQTNAWRVLTPSQLSKAVKEGVTNNSITLTDTEKASARNWIGADGNTWEQLVDKTLEANSTTALAYTDYAYEGKFKKIMIQIRGTVDTNNANISFYRALSSSAYQVFGNVAKNSDTLYEFTLEGKPYVQATAIRDSSVELKVYNVSANTWTMLYQGRAPVASTMDNVTDLKITSNGNFQTGTRVVVWGLR